MRCLELSLWPVQCRKHTEYIQQGPLEKQKKGRRNKKPGKRRCPSRDGHCYVGGKKKRRVLAYAKAYTRRWFMPHWYQILQSLRVYLFMILLPRWADGFSTVFKWKRKGYTRIQQRPIMHLSWPSSWKKKKTSKGRVSKSYENISVCKKEPE